MSGPARAGVFIYAKNVQRLAHFYQSLLGMTRAHVTPDLIVLNSADLQITVHAMPPHLAAQVEISSPPQRRDGAAYKFFFTVPSLADAAALAASLDGELLAEQWRGPGFVVHNVIDPEGNIFQLRERVA